MNYVADVSTVQGIVFRVSGSHSVKVSLGNTDSPNYSDVDNIGIIFGSKDSFTFFDGRLGTDSFMVYNRFFRALMSPYMEPLVFPNKQSTYWISWSNRIVKVGTGTTIGENQIQHDKQLFETPFNGTISRMYVSGTRSSWELCPYIPEIRTSTSSTTTTISRTTTTSTTTTRPTTTSTTTTTTTTRPTTSAATTLAPSASPFWINLLLIGRWSLLDGNLRSLSINDDGSVYGTNLNNDIFFKSCLSCLWVQIPGKLAQIDSKSRDLVIGVSQTEEIFRFNSNPAPGVAPSFVKLPGSARWASIGIDGDMWCVNSMGKIYRWVSNNAADLITNSWVQIAGSGLQISVGNRNNICLTDSNNDVYRFLNGNWILFADSKLMFVSVSSDGKVFGVSRGNYLYGWTGSKFQVVAQPVVYNMKYVSISSSGKYVASTNKDGLIYYMALTQ